MSTPQVLIDVPQQVIYLMGVSFVLGSLVTIFILLILDMMRVMRASTPVLSNEQDAQDAEIPAPEPATYDEGRDATR